MRTKRWVLPLKVAAALALSIVASLVLGWDKSYWAAFAVIIMAATETTGHSLKIGRLRLLGTFAGIIITFLLVGLFGQQAFVFLTVYSVVIATCVYQQTNTRHGYAWRMAIIVSSIIINMGNMTAGELFLISTNRLEETILGILCFSLIFSIFSPVSSRVALIKILKDNATNKVDEIEEAINSLNKTSTLNKKNFDGDNLKYLARIDDVLQAAKIDSYQVNRDFAIWESIRDLQNQWNLVSGHIYEALSLLEKPFTKEQKKDLIVILTQLKNRYLNNINLLEYVLEDPQATKNDLLYHINNTTLQPTYNCTLKSLLDYQHSLDRPLGMLRKNLLKMDTVQEQIYQHLVQAMVSDKPLQPRKKKPTNSAILTITLESECLINALKIFIIFWISVALWVYVPIQGGAMFVVLTLVYGSVALSIPFLSPRYTLSLVVFWSVLALFQYTLILPNLSQLWQIGVFYFINVFIIWFYFNRPEQIMDRLLGCQVLMLITSSATTQIPSYSINMGLLTIALISMGLLIILWVYNGIYSSQPEFVFLRQLDQFRISLYLRIKKNLTRKKIKFISIEMLAPVQTVSLAEMASSKINWSNYSDVDKQQVTTLLNLTYRACFHYRAFEDNYNNWKIKNYSEGINRLITQSLIELAKNVRSSNINEKKKENNISTLCSLKEKLLTHKNNKRLSIITTAFTEDEIDINCELITSLLILIQSIKDIDIIKFSKSQLSQMKSTPFSL